MIRETILARGNSPRLFLPAEHFPTGNWDLEKTSVHYFGDINSSPLRPRIGIAMRDPADGDILISVMREFAGLANLVVFADGQARVALDKSDLKAEKTEYPISPIASIAEEIWNTDAVFTGLSSKPGSETALIATARAAGIPSILFENLPGSGMRVFSMKGFSEYVHPDVLIEPHISGVSLIKNSYPGFRGDIEVFSSPAFDRFADTDRVSTRVRVRNILGLNQKALMITFLGGTKDQLPAQGFAELAECLQDLGFNGLVGLRRHPRDLDVTPDYLYQQTLDKLGHQAVVSQQSFYSKSEITTDEITMASDLVVSAGSTAGWNALMMGVYSMNMMHEKYVGRNPNIIPTMLDGTSPNAYDKGELTLLLKKFLDMIKTGVSEEYKSKVDSWKISKPSAPEIANFVISKALAHRESILSYQ